ncbi:4Fe-4S dicluster domain-containing protein [Burkholderia multivorans]|uniref:4Fe-4S dicluster domain-containing protein n=1 Tax=Burkholderia multivorans TaxID=87883 RepID=UPI000CFFFF81|nr:4Fe-4S dicluster domain-containing protein [Burkholderia multivorans]PRH18944.1 effector protein [Burkholderia multivorans]
MNRFIVCEPSKCIGCHTCEIACVFAHEPTQDIENINARNFDPRLHLVLTGHVSATATCHQCEDAPCVNVCPTHATHYEAGFVGLSDDACIGCRSCVVACPFGAMDMVEHTRTRPVPGIKIMNVIKSDAQKCDLCIGRAGGPACVSACPTKALSVMDRDAMTQMVQERQHQVVLAMAQAQMGQILDAYLPAKAQS